MKTPPDPIIAELRAVRDAHAARFNYDVAAIFRDIQRMQEALGRECISLPARRLVAKTASAEVADPVSADTKSRASS